MSDWTARVVTHKSSSIDRALFQAVQPYELDAGWSESLCIFGKQSLAEITPFVRYGHYVATGSGRTGGSWAAAPLRQGGKPVGKLANNITNRRARSALKSSENHSHLTSASTAIAADARRLHCIKARRQESKRVGREGGETPPPTSPTHSLPLSVPTSAVLWRTI